MSHELTADKLDGQGREGIAMNAGNCTPNVPGAFLCGTEFETCLDVDMDVRHAQT